MTKRKLNELLKLNNRGMGIAQVVALIAVLTGTTKVLYETSKTQQNIGRDALQDTEKAALINDIRTLLSSDTNCSYAGGSGGFGGMNPAGVTNMTMVNNSGNNPEYRAGTTYGKVRLERLTFGSGCTAIAGSTTLCETTLTLNISKLKKGEYMRATNHDIRIAVTLDAPGGVVSKCSATGSSDGGRWSNSTNGGVFFTDRVGIGTNIPSVQLEVNGDGLIAGILTVAQNTSVGNDLSLTNNAVMNPGTLGVTGASTLQSTLNATGAANLNASSGTTSITGATSINSTLNVTGLTTLSNTTNVSGATTLNTLINTGAATFTNTVDIQSTLTVDEINSRGILNLSGNDIINVGNINSQTGNYTITNTGNITGTIFTGTSDERLKSNAQMIFDGLDRILQLNGYTYHHLLANETMAGVMAQNVLPVMPELVRYNYKRHGNTYYTVDYRGMSAYMIDALKTLDKKVKRNQKLIDFLERKICTQRPDHKICLN